MPDELSVSQAALREARDACTRALDVADKMSFAVVAFACRSWLARIDAAECNFELARRNRLTMLNVAPNDEQRGHCHYWLWQLIRTYGTDPTVGAIDGDVISKASAYEHGKEALRIYRELARERPMYEFVEGIEELNAALPSSSSNNDSL